ncbi:acyl-CoA thioester hydrolase/BAAT C-terminal domain-containing protein [Chryseolinea lacunae]|uniref:Acetylxylan esterase n=1 Tax=Chryseolinea lacunae TaxID=2801331 RepID=A0ABS1KMN7_9BACT|nr:acyl-CoA thioester hydrolase/BAAT C-terminal domain-containing protein [Chryseolinea lacunae]MBL0740507.1 acetylxylan esterase [Chryseolinea lacunae]
MKFLFFSTCVALLLCFACNSTPDHQGKVNTQLYLGDGPNQPLIVGLGGSEGGNAWTSDRWETTRNKFLEKGYAFLAVGYFGMDGLPSQLDRIPVEAVHDAMVEAAKNPNIDSHRIAIIGGSKGAELALLLASLYPDINGVVGIVPGYAVFPALTLNATTSSWTYAGKEVPFVPMPWAAVPSAMKGDLRGAFDIMIEDKEAVSRARIKIENIHGPILFLSATRDEMWPSREMADAMMKQLDAVKFPYAHKHIVVEGGHTKPQERFDSVLVFLERNFRNTK